MDLTATNRIVTGLADIFVLVGVILGIEWIFLPFAIFKHQVEA